MVEMKLEIYSKPAYRFVFCGDGKRGAGFPVRVVGHEGEPPRRGALHPLLGLGGNGGKN